MQSTKDKAMDAASFKPQITVEDLIHIIKVKEAETNAYRKQNEQLKMKLSEYREKEDSLQDIPVTQKSQLLRAKSDPVSGQSKWNSHPEIFLFPENKSKDSQQTQEPQKLLSPPLSNLSMYMEPENVHGSLCLNKVDIDNEPDASLNLRSNIPTSWLDPSMASQGCTGVSEQYFKNVLNELVKTKKYLNNLLTHQNQNTDRTVELNNLKQEVQQLHFTQRHLERELDEIKEENLKLKAKVPLVKSAKADDSFELESKVTCSAKSTQTDQQNSFQMLCNQVTKLNLEKQNQQDEFHYTVENMVKEVDNKVKENQGLKREREELQTSYKNLSTQVLSLSTLLQEEQVKNKNQEESLRTKTIEAKRLSEKMCILRQKIWLGKLWPNRSYGQTVQTLIRQLFQELSDLALHGLQQNVKSHLNEYEELLEEKNALEKNLALLGPRARHHSQPRSIPTSGMSPRFHSQDKRHHITFSPDSSKHSFPSSSRPDYGPPLPAPLLDQAQGRLQAPTEDVNNLSQDERKLSNLPNRMQFSSSMGPQGTVPRFREDCPTCLQTFTNENSYHAHLEKCIE